MCQLCVNNILKWSDSIKAKRAFESLSTQQKETFFLPSNQHRCKCEWEKSVPGAHVSTDLILKIGLRGCREGVAFTAAIS